MRKAVSLGCSDIHIKPGSPPKMRKDGKLVVIPGYEGEILDTEQTRLLAFETMSSTDMSTFHHKIYDHDYAFEILGVGRFRMNVFKTRGATAFVGRLIQNKAKSLAELGVPPIVSRLAALHAGIIIVAGATSSGKSTTMAGIIDFINKSRAVNIISVEDPIEIVHTDAMASIAQREVGSDVGSYESALKAALREDPDVILIGEIRDLETLKTALLAADTGHLVITTLHTTDTAETINRILSMYPQNERDNTRRALASSLRGIIGQRLVPKLSGGRVVVNEVLLNTPEITAAILDPNQNAQSIKAIIERNNHVGMQSFEQQFVNLIEAGIIDLRTAKDKSVTPEYYDTIDIKFPNGFNPETELVVPNISVSKQIPSGKLPNFFKPLPVALEKPPSLPTAAPVDTEPQQRIKLNRNPLR
jgi:twitching motility protein PilT